MAHTSNEILIIWLVFLILLSAFFSSSETGMMSLNRYRLRHRARQHHKAAQRVEKMLKRPDRLLGVILVGNTFANLLASAIFTRIDLGGLGLVWSTAILTFFVLIFGEIAPKTLGALYPMRLSFIVSLPLLILQRLLYPLVWFATMISNGLLQMFGIKIKRSFTEALSRDELRTVVDEARSRISKEHADMLVSILDLERASVDDIMIPRAEINGIDLSDDWETIQEQLKKSTHTRIPLYRDHINQVVGFLHMRLVINLLSNNQLTKENLMNATTQPYFVPKGTSLYSQLANFRQSKERMALVVDEYGDVIGLTTLEDILEEIVGEFTTDVNATNRFIQHQPDGSYLIDGAVTLRELNRNLGFELPIDGPNTLSGLIIEFLETIPSPGICVLIANYPIEVLQVKGNKVKLAKVSARLKR